MGKFAIKLLLFAVIFLIFDKLFIIVAHFSAEAEANKRLEYLVNGEVNKDIIIIGSSSGSRDIIASQIEETTGLSTYNLCYPGSNVEFHEFIMRTLVKFNEPPEIAMLVVDDNTELLHNETTNFRKDRLYPLVKYPYIWRELSQRDERDKLFSHFLILNRLNKYNFDIRKKRFTPIDTIQDCGSMPISWKPEDMDFEYVSGERPYPVGEELPEKVEAYKKLIETCKTNNINLVVVFPPFYQTHSESFEKRIRQLSGDGVYYYLYNTENPVYRYKDNYFDESHLMQNAAIEFTGELITYLNDLIENEIKIDN
ncbi:MAG: hypothetical protein K8R63_00245 [Bacteroidales bacterium]|nr:hypothetical protein [Bacteroidales bacterium]